MQATITAIILTKNEENNIVDCIDSLSWSDEILVIDDNSTDRTVDLARKHKATVISHPLTDDFAAQRNFALSKANGEWVIFIDADERISLSLQYEILSYITNPMNQYKGYIVKRVDTLWRRKLKYGEIGATKLLRIAKKDSGGWVGKVHEVWKIKGNTFVLQNPLDHFPHQSVTAFLSEINHYSTLRAKELFEKKVKSTPFAIIGYPVGKFFYTFIFLRGFLDGIAGLMVALLMTFHSFLVRSKLWLLWVNVREK